ncbi:hypothetical protein Q6247_25510, partial [Klebsiella pneumoniae]
AHYLSQTGLESVGAQAPLPALGRQWSPRSPYMMFKKKNRKEGGGRKRKKEEEPVAGCIVF